MATAYTLDDFRAVINRLADKYRVYHEGLLPWAGEPQCDDYVPDYNLHIPPWICQPYYRLPPEKHKELMQEKVKLAEKREKRKFFDRDGNAISRKHMKKLRRIEKHAKVRMERNGEICVFADCGNTRGLKCDYNLCRHCCRKKCKKETVECVGHKKIQKIRAATTSTMTMRNVMEQAEDDRQLMEAD
jgi:tRNA-dihydrouridine synthase 1